MAIRSANCSCVLRKTIHKIENSLQLMDKELESLRSKFVALSPEAVVTSKGNNLRRDSLWAKLMANWKFVTEFLPKLREKQAGVASMLLRAGAGLKLRSGAKIFLGSITLRNSTTA